MRSTIKSLPVDVCITSVRIAEQRRTSPRNMFQIQNRQLATIEYHLPAEKYEEAIASGDDRFVDQIAENYFKTQFKRTGHANEIKSLRRYDEDETGALVKVIYTYQIWQRPLN